MQCALTEINIADLLFKFLFLLQGVPKFLESYGCVVYFEWQSSVACKTPSQISETRCYIYDKQKKLIDLTPLIKSSGNYSVSRDDDDDDDDRNNNGGALYINVCREIPALNGDYIQLPIKHLIKFLVNLKYK